MSAALKHAVTVGRRLAILAVMVVILVRPSWGEAKVATKEADLDVLVVVDRTRSMIAEDGPGGTPRLDLVKKDLVALAADLPGARFSAITFGGEVVRDELPFTTDASAFDSFAESLRVEGPFDGAGSRVDAPLEKTEGVLKDDEQEYPDRRRIVIVVSDGENTASGSQESFAPLRDYLDGGEVLGYGTTEGGKMLIDSEHPSEGYMTDPSTYEPAVSHIDEANLQKVAGQLGVGYAHRTAPDPAGLARIAASFKSSQVDSHHTTLVRPEKTWIFGFVLLPLLLWELWAHRRTAREVRRMLR